MANSKSSKMTCSKSLRVLVTGRPPLEQRMLRAVDQSAFITERQPKYLGRLDLGPDRSRKSIGRGREDLVDLVFAIGEQPHPFLFAAQQPDFLGAVVFILIAVLVGAADRNDAHRSL